MPPIGYVHQMLTQMASSDQSRSPGTFGDRLRRAAAELLPRTEVGLVVHSAAAGRAVMSSAGANIVAVMDADEVEGEGPVTSSLGTVAPRSA